MATITLNMTLAIQGTNDTASCVVSKSITQSSEKNTIGTQIIGATTEAITFGDVTAPGYIAIVNQDATNFVMIGLATPVTSGDAFAKLLPGEGCIVPTRQTVIYAIADTAPCNISKHIYSL